MPIVLSGSLELTGSVVATGNFTTAGNITAQTLVVQTITSSIVNITGSNIFGSQISNRQTFTGSFYQTGSLAYFSNCVGIGTTTPYAPLQVTGSIKIATGNAQGILGLGEANGSTINVGLWRGAANATTTDGNYLNIGGYDGIILAASNAAIGSQCERMRITSTGTVLVNANTSTYGAASGYSLGVKGTTGQSFISIARTGQNLDSQGMILGLDTTTAYLAVIDNINFKIDTNNTERFRITCDGVVSINCNASFAKGAKLQILQSSSNTNAIDFKNSDATYGHIGTFANNLYLTQNYYYAGGQNNDSATYGQAAITMGVSNVAGDTSIDFSMSDPGATSPSSKMRLFSVGCGVLLVGTTTCTAEASLVLGAKGANEGGQLVLQKGTSCSCTTHLDNYNDAFRVLVGTDTASNGVHFLIDHKSRCAVFFGNVYAPYLYLNCSTGIQQVAAGRNLSLNTTTYYDTGLGQAGLLVVNSSADRVGVFAMSVPGGGNSSIVEISDPSACYSTTCNTANSVNFFFSGGSGNLIMQNCSGGTKSFSLTMLGTA